MGLGTGTLGMRLEKAGVVGMITSRNKLSGFANPFAAQNAGGGGGRGGAGGPGGQRRSGSHPGRDGAATGRGPGSTEPGAALLAR